MDFGYLDGFDPPEKERLNIYLVEQDINNDYDTYDSFIVIAESEQQAREIHPSAHATHHKNGEWYGTYAGGNNIGGEYVLSTHDWIDFSAIHLLKVTHIGVANKDSTPGVVLASFNAG